MSPWRISGQFRNDGLFVLPAWLNNQPFKLLFDPGTAYSMIKPSVAALLNLRAISSRRVLQGAYYPVDCPVYQLDSFQLGFIQRANMRVVAISPDAQLGFHGLIGMDFLRQYRFTVEPDTATLILRPRRK
jgi:predicted aspartyl protease